MKVLLLALGNAPARQHFESIHCENYLGRYEEGHEIITFGYNEDVDIRIGPEDDFEKVVEGLPEGWNPDCCICWEVDWNLLPKDIDKASFPVVVVPWDWDHDVPLSRAIVKSADITIALADFEREALDVLGGNAELFYPIGIMKKYMDTAPKKITDRKYDIFYTSTIDRDGRSDRAKWILKMCSLSGKYNVFFRENLPDFDEYVKTLRDSKLVLSHHRFGSMSGRILEAGAQGTVVLETGTEVKKHFGKDKEYIPVTEENFIKQVERYLKDEEALQAISDSVHGKVTRNYEANKQFLAMLGFLEEKFGAGKYSRSSGRLSEAQRHIRNGEIYYYSYFRCTGYFLMNTGTKLLELAVSEFRKAVEAERTAGAMTALAVSLAALSFSQSRNSMSDEKEKEAIAILEEVVSGEPLYIMATFNLGLVHYRNARFPEAMAAFEKAVMLLDDPDSVLDPWCLHNRDFDLFNQIFRKPLNNALMSLCRGAEKEAADKIRGLFRSMILYMIALMQESEGHVFRALDALRESRRANPEFDMVVLKAARLSAALGIRDESLNMYESVIKLMPFNINCRIEHFELLYLYDMDKKLFDAVTEALKISGTVDQLKDTVPLIKRAVHSFGISSKGLGYSYDPGKDKILLKFAGVVYGALVKDPGNITLMARIIEIWRELGMMDNIFVLINEYIQRHLDRKRADDKICSCLLRIMDDLEKQCSVSKRAKDQKLTRIRRRLSLTSAEPIRHDLSGCK